MEMTTIRIAEKSSSTTEIAAPWANSIPSCAYPEISPVAERVDPLVDLLADLDALEAVVVEPDLQPVDVHALPRSGRSPSRSSVT